MRVCVIGAGYLGLAAYYEALGRGHNVTLIDSKRKDAGSRISPGWYDENELLTPEFEATIQGVNWYSDNHIIAGLDFLGKLDSEIIESVSTEADDLENDWITVYKIPAVEKMIVGEVESIVWVSKNYYSIKYNGGIEIKADAIVLATGPGNTHNAAEFGWPRSNLSGIVRGRNWVFDNTNITASIYENDVRVSRDNMFEIIGGNSFEDNSDLAGRKTYKQLQKIISKYDVVKPLAERVGFYEIGPGGSIYCENLGIRFVTIGGAGKFGLYVAGGLGFEAVNRIEAGR